MSLIAACLIHLPSCSHQILFFVHSQQACTFQRQPMRELQIRIQSRSCRTELCGMVMEISHLHFVCELLQKLTISSAKVYKCLHQEVLSRTQLPKPLFEEHIQQVSKFCSLFIPNDLPIFVCSLACPLSLLSLSFHSSLLPLIRQMFQLPVQESQH